MPLPKNSPPSPELANLVLASAPVTRESWVRLTTGPPQVVVTDSTHSPKSPDGNARDLLLLSCLGALVDSVLCVVDRRPKGVLSPTRWLHRASR